MQRILREVCVQRKTYTSSRINMLVFSIYPVMCGSMKLGAKYTGAGIFSGLGISVICGRRQGDKSQADPEISENPSERALRGWVGL